MLNFFKTLRGHVIRLNLSEIEYEQVLACALFLAYAHACLKKDISDVRELSAVAGLIGLDDDRDEVRGLRGRHLTDELLETLGFELKSSSICEDPGRFVAEVFKQLGEEGSRDGNWSGASFSLLETMVEWTKGAGRVAVVDRAVSALAPLLASRSVPVDLYVRTKEMACLARVASQYLGLDLHEHVLEYDEIRQLFSELNGSTGLVEMHPRSQSDCCSEIDRLADIVPGPVAAALPPTVASHANYAETRKRLLESGRLYAIVSLPAGLLTFSSSPLDLYLLSAKDAPRCDRVRMLAMKDERFWDRPATYHGVRNFSEAGLAAIRNLLAQGEPGESEALVPADDLLKTREVSLAVERHVVSREVLDSIEFLKHFPRTLGDVAEIVRPKPIRHSMTKGRPFQEVAQGINEFGVIDGVGRHVFVEEELSDSFKAMILHPGDILYFIKGPVGECGLVCDGPDNWICSQTSVVIRLRPGVRGMTPTVLMRYLRSETVVKYFSAFISGAAARYLPLTALLSLPVPELSDEELRREEEQFQKQLAMLREISKIREEARGLSLRSIPCRWKRD